MSKIDTTFMTFKEISLLPHRAYSLLVSRESEWTQKLKASNKTQILAIFFFNFFRRHLTRPMGVGITVFNSGVRPLSTYTYVNGHPHDLRARYNVQHSFQSMAFAPTYPSQLLLTREKWRTASTASCNERNNPTSKTDPFYQTIWLVAI